MPDNPIATALIWLLSVVLGCVHNPERTPRIDKAKYEKISIELYHLQHKGRFTLSDTEKFYKKHGVTRADYEDAIISYGKAESVKAEERNLVPQIGAYDLWFFRRGPGKPQTPFIDR